MSARQETRAAEATVARARAWLGHGRGDDYDMNKTKALMETERAEQLVLDSSQCQNFMGLMATLTGDSLAGMSEEDVANILDKAVTAPKDNAIMSQAAAPAAAALFSIRAFIRFQSVKTALPSILRRYF